MNMCSIHYGKLDIDFVLEGDLGRDLYIYYLSSKGMLPYINFNWIYGPLSPILYGLIFKLGGISILNAQTVWYSFFALSTFLIFWVIKKISNFLFGFLAGTMFYINYGFLIQTFNHILGVPPIILSIYFYYKYLENQKKNIYLNLLAICLFFIAITKLNMALTYMLSVYIPLTVYKISIKEKLTPIFKSFCLFIILSGMVYIPLIIFSPLDQITKSFPYGKNYLMSLPVSFFRAIFMTDVSQAFLVNFNFTWQKQLHYFFYSTTWYYIILITGIIYTVVKLIKEKRISEDVVFTAFLTFSFIFLSHEFMIVKTFYSLRYWCLPFYIVLLFYLLNKMSLIMNTNKPLKSLYYLLLYITVCSIIALYYVATLYNYNKSYYFPYQRSKIELTNYPWNLSAYATFDYINKNIPKSEKILALPYNMIYNFISERDQPTRYTEFIYLSGLTEIDEQKVINDLKKNNIKWILYSLKFGNIQGGVGTFGKTHCKILYKYIEKNYSIVNIIHFKNRKVRVCPIIFLKRNH